MSIILDIIFDNYLELLKRSRNALKFNRLTNRIKDFLFLRS